MNILKTIVDEEHPLDTCALLVRRAGLEHLVVDPSCAEVQAMADAGDRLAMERAALQVAAFLAPAEAMRPFDGGASARALLKRAAYAASEACRAR